MAHEIVDDDIEQHLLERISQCIERKGDQQNLVSRYYSLGPDFEELMNILTPNTNPVHKQNWSSVRRQDLYSLNNLLNEWQLIKKRSSFAPVEDHEACANIKKSLKKMMKELKGEESSSRGVPEHSVSHHQDPKHPVLERNKKDVYRWSSRHGPRKVHGFEHHAMAMERDLVMRDVNAPYKVFGVVGVAGIGKTTLCQEVFGRKLVRENFCPRIWVCLSKQPGDDDDYRKEIVIRILKCLGIEDEVISDTGKVGDEYGLRKLVLLLRLQLIGKRYLIVLDDVWNDDEFFLKLTRPEEPNMKWGEELAYALPKGGGGAIISSGRSDVLLKKMLGKDVGLLYLKPHTDEIINEIFRDAVIGYDEDERDFPEHLKELKMEILKKCDGIPLAAKLFAKIARKPLPLKFEPPPSPTYVGGSGEITQIPASGGERLEGCVDAGGSGSGGHENIQVPASGGEQLKGGGDASGNGGAPASSGEQLEGGKQLEGGVNASGIGSSGDVDKQTPTSGGEQLKGGVDADGKPTNGGEQLESGVDSGGTGSGGHEDKPTPASGGEQLKDDVDTGGTGSGGHEVKPTPANGGEQLKDGVDAGGTGTGGHEVKPAPSSGGEQLKDGVDAGGIGSGGHEVKPALASGGENLKDGVDAGGTGSSSHEVKPAPSSGGKQLKDGVDAGGTGSGGHEVKPAPSSGGEQLKDGVNAGGTESGGHEVKPAPSSGGEQLKDGVDAGGTGSGGHEGKPAPASDEQLKGGVGADGKPASAGEQLEGGINDGGSGYDDKQAPTSGDEQLKGGADTGDSGNGGH